MADSNPTIRTCRRCKTEQPLDAFVKVKGCYHGRSFMCRKCDYQRQLEWRNAHADKEKYRAARRLSDDKVKAAKYGLTLAEFHALRERARGLCEICGNPPRGKNGHRADSYLHVDHCHETGKVRGLLCSDCNRGLGIFRDDVERLRRAADYLCKP